MNESTRFILHPAPSLRLFHRCLFARRSTHRSSSTAKNLKTGRLWSSLVVFGHLRSSEKSFGRVPHRSAPVLGRRNIARQQVRGMSLHFTRRTYQSQLPEKRASTSHLRFFRAQ